MCKKLLITNGRILTMAGKVLPKGCVLTENGRITAVADQIEIPEDKDTEIIDASGCLVMPGLIEAHCHVGITEEKKGMEGDDCNENVSPVTPWLRALDAINTMDAAFDDAVRAGITSIMAGPGSSNVVGGQFVFLKTKGRRIDDLIVKEPAAMKIAFGENPKVNFMDQQKSPVTRMAIAGLLREELFKAREYQKKKQAWQKKNQGKSQSSPDSPFEPDFRMEPWLPVLEELAKEGFPAIVGPDLSSRSKIEVQNMAFKTAAVLHQAGVLVAITTDHPVTLIQSLPLCAGLAVKSGLPMEEGLRAITCNPARICRVYDRVGSLEPGKDADIAIFTGNPMETFTKTMCTIINGTIAYRDENF